MDGCHYSRTILAFYVHLRMAGRMSVEEIVYALARDLDRWRKYSATAVIKCAKEMRQENSSDASWTPQKKTLS